MKFQLDSENLIVFGAEAGRDANIMFDLRKQ